MAGFTGCLAQLDTGEQSTTARERLYGHSAQRSGRRPAGPKPGPEQYSDPGAHTKRFGHLDADGHRHAEPVRHGFAYRAARPVGVVRQTPDLFISAVRSGATAQQ